MVTVERRIERERDSRLTPRTLSIEFYQLPEPVDSPGLFCVWLSEDGVSWVESRHDIPDMKDITVADDRLIAVAALGHELISEEGQFNDPPLYFSDDGTTWTGIPRANFESPQIGRLFELNAIVSDCCNDHLKSHADMSLSCWMCGWF